MNEIVTDQGSLVPRRLNDGAVFEDGVLTIGIVVGQLLDINYTEDGGVSWTPANLGWALDSNQQARGVAFSADGLHGIAVGDMLGPPFVDPVVGKGFIARTTGSPSPYTDWVIEAAPPFTRDLHDVTFAPAADCDGSNPPETAYAVGENGVVRKSTDWGDNWATVNTPNDLITLYGASFADPCYGYVVGEQASVYRTTDGGTTWSQITISASGETIYDIETWGDGTNAIAVGEDGGVWVSGGNRFVPIDWTSYNLIVDEDLFDVEVVDGGQHVWVSGEDGILLHRDGALNWTKPRSGTTLNIPKVAFPTSTTGYAIGQTFTFLKYE